MKNLKNILFAFSILLFLSCTKEAEKDIQVKTDPIEDVFKQHGFEGCFQLYDLKNDSTVVFNEKRCNERFTPASTFKIVNSLIGLETGIIQDEDFVIKWDSVERYYPRWNKDHDLKTAFKNSTVWYYQELARRAGRDSIEKYVKMLEYGNMDLSGDIDKFWLSGNLKISPNEQIALLKKLYHNKLPFSQRTMDIVKKIMVFKESKDYIIRAKTGGSDIYNVGWFVGWGGKGGQCVFLCY